MVMELRCAPPGALTPQKVPPQGLVSAAHTYGLLGLWDSILWTKSHSHTVFFNTPQTLGDFRGRIGWASSPILWLPDLLDLFQPKARLGMQAVWGSALSARFELLLQNNCTHPPSLPRRVLVLYPLLTCTCVFISLRLQPGKFWKEMSSSFHTQWVEWMKHVLGSWSALGTFISCMSMSPLWWWPQDWLCGSCNPCSSRSRAPVLPNRQMAPAGLKGICEAGKENMPREMCF